MRDVHGLIDHRRAREHAENCVEYDTAFKFVNISLLKQACVEIGFQGDIPNYLLSCHQDKDTILVCSVFYY